MITQYKDISIIYYSFRLLKKSNYHHTTTVKHKKIRRISTDNILDRNTIIFESLKASYFALNFSLMDSIFFLAESSRIRLALI
jgi:hypothetical protein